VSSGMKKTKLEIVGLSYSQTQSGAYALVLGEAKGKRRLPIIIGGFEAQAIAIELEKMTPSRPLTHDLFKSFAESFSIELKEVLIYNLVEGIFFAKLICSNGTNEVEIDARTSDAIALAVRFNCPIYTFEFILSQAGIVLDDEKPEQTLAEETVSGEMTNEEEEELLAEATSGPDLHRKSLKELEEMLTKAIADENYERASRIRDELNKRRSA
jgi:bifunctional DNase/RNase